MIQHVEELPLECERQARMTARPQFEPLLDCREAASLLRIHPKTVLKMARAGELPGIRFGKLWRFRTSDLDAWLGSRVSCDNHQCRSGK